MEHRNGVGSILYGKKRVDKSDGSYQAVEWVIFFFVPIWPLGTFRVRRVGDSELTVTNGIFAGAETPIEMTKIKMDWLQVLTTFIGFWVSAILILWVLNEIFY